MDFKHSFRSPSRGFARLLILVIMVTGGVACTRSPTTVDRDRESQIRTADNRASRSVSPIVAQGDADQALRDHVGEDHDHDDHDHAHGLGSHVDHGDAEEQFIDLTPQARASLDLETVTLKPGKFVNYQSMPATVTDWPGRTHITITAPMTGIVGAIYITPGELIRSGQRLFTMRLTHQDLVKTQSDFLSALGRLDVEQREIERLNDLARTGAIAGKTLIQHEYDHDILLAQIQAQRQAMLLHGLGEAQIAQIESTRRLVREITIYAPTLHRDNSLHHDSEIDQNHGSPIRGETAAGRDDLVPWPPSSADQLKRLPEDRRGGGQPSGSGLQQDHQHEKGHQDDQDHQHNHTRPESSFPVPLGLGLTRAENQTPSSDPVSVQTRLRQTSAVDSEIHDLEVEYVVTRLAVDRGQAIEAGQELGRLSDYSQLLIEGHAFQDDASLLRIAANLRLPLQAVLASGSRRSEIIDGLHLNYIGNEVALDSRSLPFYVPVDNRIERSEQRDDRRYLSWLFKPGQRLQIRVPYRALDQTFVVSKDAVVQDGLEHYVFVDHGDHFERRPVRVLAKDSVSCALAMDGSVRTGQPIATTGAHQLQMAFKQAQGGPIDPHAGHTH